MMSETTIPTTLLKTQDFVITKDYIFSPRFDTHSYSQEPKAVLALKKEGYNRYFELFDDDGEKYYGGYLHENAEGEDQEFAPLDWGMYNAGCTGMKVRNNTTGQMEYL